MSNEIISMSDMTIGEILNKRFIECSVRNLEVVRQERTLFLKEIGGELNKPGDSERARIVNGHRAVTGNIFRLIREAGGYSLEEMATRCMTAADELEFYEQMGFMEALEDKLFIDTVDMGFVAPIYGAWIKGRVYIDYMESDEISFEDIIEFNDAMIADIKHELSQLDEISDEAFIYLMENIKASYETINDILKPYRTY